MPRIFLDACIFIDIISNRQDFDLTILPTRPHISTLSIHIAHYVAKAQCPDKEIIDLVNQLHQVPLSLNLANQALTSPTQDYEDNIQLLSAHTAGCDIFITDDKSLLKLKHIPNISIVHPRDLPKQL